MSIFSAFFQEAGDSRQAFRASDITSPEMRAAIEDWFSLYFQSRPTRDADPCQRLAYTVVRKLTKTVFAEYAVRGCCPFADGVLRSLDEKRAEAVQMALIGGECLLKPVPEGRTFRFAVIPRTNFWVFGRDAAGALTDMATAECTDVERFRYTLLERRRLDEEGRLVITNRLYRSGSPERLGQPVSLDTLPKYAALPAQYVFPEPLDGLGVVSLRTPMVNCVDGSADAVSVYAAAVPLIRNIDRLEAQLSGEFDRGQSRIVVSRDMLDGGKLRDNLFVGLDESPENVGVTVFAPQLREQSFLARKQDYLRAVENVIGLKRGLLSDVEAQPRTATEITSTAGEYSLTIQDFQRMWEDAVRRAVALCGRLGQLYRIPGAHRMRREDLSFFWGNGVLYDEERTGREMLEQVRQGILQPERYLGWYYDLPCDTEKQRERIRKAYMPAGGESPLTMRF